MSDYSLHDTSMLATQKEYGDEITLSIMSIFPNVVFQQIGNSLATRQIRCKGVDAFELYWTYYGYEDDTPEMTAHRLRQANMAGPGGLISMEDGEAVEIVHRAIKREPDKHSVAEYGGRGEIKTQDTLITEVPMRGFWAYYCQLMGIEPNGVAA
jgi:anthranilate 1,2-dioxygenase large subunit